MYISFGDTWGPTTVLKEFVVMVTSGLPVLLNNMLILSFSAAHFLKRSVVMTSTVSAHHIFPIPATRSNRLPLLDEQDWSSIQFPVFNHHGLEDSWVLYFRFSCIRDIWLVLDQFWWCTILSYWDRNECKCLISCRVWIHAYTILSKVL